MLAKPSASAELDALEKRHGRLSMVARAWYETFDSVVFVQSRAQLTEGPTDLMGFGHNPTLTMGPFPEGLRELSEYEDSWDLKEDGPLVLPCGPVWSNCANACFKLAVHGFDDTEFRTDKEGDQQCFVAFLRDSIQWGGFSFWSYLEEEEEEEDVRSPKPDLEEILARLMDGMIPF